MIAYSGESADGPNELMLQDHGKAAETLTSLNQFLKQRQLGSLLRLGARSSADGTPVEGWALLPPGSTGENKLPMILALHGGPFGDDGPDWSSEYGEGVENYMNDSPVDIGVKTNPGNPVMPIKGVPLPVLGTVTFLDHTWSEKFQSSIGYSFQNIDNSNAEVPSDFHQGDYALGNLTFYPVKNVMVGSEFQFGRRVNFLDGFNVNDYKLQFTAKFNYSRLFGHSY